MTMIAAPKVVSNSLPSMTYSVCTCVVTSATKPVLLHGWIVSGFSTKLSIFILIYVSMLNMVVFVVTYNSHNL